MYKKFFMGIAAMAALTLVSCSSDDLNSLSDNSSKNEAISFDGYLGRSAVAVNGSRGSVVDLNALKSSSELDKKGFGVFGYYSTTDHSAPEQSFDANLFNNERVTCPKDGADWTYDNKKYWPSQGHIDFYAYAPFETGKTLNKKTSATPTTTTPTFDFTVSKTIANQTDLLWANAENRTKDKLSSADKNKVKFTFAHALSRLGYTAKLNDAYSSATITLNKITLAGSSENAEIGAFYTKGTIDLSKPSSENPWTPLDKDNKLKFDWFSNDNTSSDNTLSKDKVIKNSGNEYLFVIPQDFSSTNTESNQLYVIVKYTIQYNGGTAQPKVSYTVYKKLEKNFLQGNAYTINLNIGLTPIEFDADVTPWNPKDGESIDASWN
ncbi:fimbrillin family protein [Prevotella copri]|uniref:fimbrillin family protein n=1 Tax=Segatella copri TaxID=165179 RepID=UPI001290EDF5|nr:fimbrillin family protein [Segatella copri]MQN28640.1 fimbrillin family protein [Segatella copri]MQO28306.1 fimbrillin family protein [Segatella copri]MQO44763.1 fimbrillin family protein [Segatella copri]MQO51025.1 fimbrillin family protein [Segatella copri]